MEKNIPPSLKPAKNQPSLPESGSLDARILKWRKKRQEQKTSLKITSSAQEEGKRIDVSIEPEEQGLSHNERFELIASTLSSISGSASTDYSRLFVNEFITTMATGIKQDMDLTINAFIEAMVTMDPKDIIEAQLCAKLILLSSKSLHFMGNALANEHPKAIDRNVNRSVKLSRLYNETLEALNRYRRKGEQKVTVQHVHVNEGGQAVVASQLTPGRGVNKKAKV